MAAGPAGIDVSCANGDCEETDGRLAFAIEDLTPGDRGTRRFTVSVDGNPVRIWLGTDCPPAEDTPAHGLGDAVEVRLRIDEDCGAGPGGRQLFPAAAGSWGTLRSFREALAGGRRLDDTEEPCLSGSEELCLVLEYRLPHGAPVPPGASSELAIDLHAEQCRHVSEASVRSPFEGADCEDSGCPDCVKLGKLEVRRDRLEERTYQFDELEAPFAGDGHTYELDVLDLTTTDHGDETTCAAFRLLRDGRASLRMCAVEVKGGRERRTHAIDPPSASTPGKLCTERSGRGSDHGGRGERDDGRDDGDDTSRRDDNGRDDRERDDNGRDASRSDGPGGDSPDRNDDHDRRQDRRDDGHGDGHERRTEDPGEHGRPQGGRRGYKGGKRRPAISYLTVSVCPDAVEDGGERQ